MSFLSRIKVDSQSQVDYPYSIPCIQHGFDIELDFCVTIFCGENDSGNSTILEALAQACGFNPAGGSRNNYYATIYTTNGKTLKKVSYQEAEHCQITKSFLQSPETYFHHLFKEEE